MARRLSWLAATATACVVMTMGQSALAQEIPLVTGKQWTQSTEQMKKAYLVGIANLAQVESAYYADKPPGDTQSIMPRLSKGLRGHTLDTVRQRVDNWYAAHPDQLSRPVIETIWFDMVIPGLQPQK
ncbi:hypothetical protein SGO26_16165 [Cupriavidus metallidurans]|jgi:hypothetical protein|nr:MULTISPECIES: hypothetical protein [Cupriavidus]QWC88485.1 hypothetical protein KB891_15985 [Cupriavidus metallidurans]GMG91708.1 hypothetical protein Cmtc_29280 [Cupriavidus sp. TKC]